MGKNLLITAFLRTELRLVDQQDVQQESSEHQASYQHDPAIDGCIEFPLLRALWFDTSQHRLCDLPRPIFVENVGQPQANHEYRHYEY